MREKLASTPPRRLIAPVGAAATLFVVAGIAISQSGAPEEGLTVAEPEVLEDTGLRSAKPPEGGSIEESALDESAQRIEESLEESAPLEFEESAPLEESAPSGERFTAKDGRRTRDAVAGASGGGGAADDVAVRRERGNAEIARDARLVLGADSDEVQDVANGVNEVTNRYRGFVVNSNVESGGGSVSAGAHFRLRIPANNLQAALADLSELADVQSRHEGTKDITGRVVSAETAIDRHETALTELEKQLAEAEGAERAQLKQQIQEVEGLLENEQASLAQAEQRVGLVPVDVEIVTDSGDGKWGLDDALEDAGDVLSAIGGGIFVAGAVLVPLALIGGIAYAIRRRSVSRSRDRALD